MYQSERGPQVRVPVVPQQWDVDRPLGLPHAPLCCHVPQHALQGAGVLIANASNIQNHSYVQRKYRERERYTTISRIHFKTITIQRVKPSTAPQRSL